MSTKNCRAIFAFTIPQQAQMLWEPERWWILAGTLRGSPCKSLGGAYATGFDAGIRRSLERWLRLRTTRKMVKATIRKSINVFKNSP